MDDSGEGNTVTRGSGCTLLRFTACKRATFFKTLYRVITERRDVSELGIPEFHKQQAAWH